MASRPPLLPQRAQAAAAEAQLSKASVAILSFWVTAEKVSRAASRQMLRLVSVLPPAKLPEIWM